MKLPEVLQRLWRWIEINVPSPVSLWRIAVWRLRGAEIGEGTRLPACRAVWPHQVRIGAHCKLQHEIFFNYDHFWTPGPSIVIGDRVFVGNHVEFNIQGRIEIGDDCLIAPGCYFVDHDHGRNEDSAFHSQPNVIQPIQIEKNVWLGAGSIVLKGVTVGEGSVIGAGSVVTRSVPAHQVWAGNPARMISLIGTPSD
jgi:acetyltransferase-like isoleucine patch superfamily enzyme